MSKQNHKSQKQIRQEKVRAQKARRQWLGFGALMLMIVAAIFFMPSSPKHQPLDEAHLTSNATPKPASAIELESGAEVHQLHFIVFASSFPSFGLTFALTPCLS